MTWKLQQQIEWRRSKVLEYVGQGFNQKEIATKLQVDESTVSRDIASLKEQARHNIKHYIEEKLPIEFEKCLAALTAVRKNAWLICQKESTNDKVKIQALALVKDCVATTMDLLTHGGVVDKAVRFVEEGSRKLQESAATDDDSNTPITITRAIATTGKRAKADGCASEHGTKEGQKVDIQGSEEKITDINTQRAETTNRIF